MAIMAAMLKTTAKNTGYTLGLRRYFHAIAPYNNVIDRTISSPPIVLLEVDRSSGNSAFGFHFPSFSIGGSMELMAVPKKKTSPRKRGIRNGPKALKPISVIVQCRSCGRVKLPHFYCCSGRNDGEGNHHRSTG